MYTHIYTNTYTHKYKALSFWILLPVRLLLWNKSIYCYEYLENKHIVNERNVQVQNSNEHKGTS